MSPIVLDILSANADVLVVTPFANDSGFVERYSRSNIKMILPPSVENLSWFHRKFLFISSILRVQGYWYRWKKVIPYYWANRHTQFSENEKDKKRSFEYRWLIDSLALLGFSSRMWRIFDFLHGQHTYRFPELFVVTSNYQKVVFIQAASWGYQDAVLGYWSRTKKWRSILLPYTTDQLMCNGWLYCNFNKVCVQGACENLWANRLHYIPESNIIKLGSIYFRVLRNSLEFSTKFLNRKEKDKLVILYAGVDSVYFPIKDEIQTVMKLESMLSQKIKKDVSIIYRPVSLNTNNLKYFDKIKLINNITLQAVSSTSIGLDDFIDENVEHKINELIYSFNQADILIMSTFTSMALEAAVMGLPVISYFPLDNKILKIRKSNLLFVNKLYNGLNSVPRAQSLDELFRLVSKIIEENDFADNIVNSIVSDWDYMTIDFENTFSSMLFSES
jgi:hypothetical protein